MSSNPTKNTKTGHSGEKPTVTDRSGGKPTGTVKSGATRPLSASKMKPKLPSRGGGIVDEYMNSQEQMLLDQASELRDEINRLDEENKGLKDEIRKLDEENTGLKAKFFKSKQVENSDNVMDRRNLERKLSDLKNENEEVKATIKEKDAEILKLQKDLEDANEQNRVLSKQNATDQQAQEENRNFEKELKEIDELMKQLQENSKSLQEKIDRQKPNEAQLKSKCEEIESLRKELENLKKNEAQQLKSKNEETESLRKELETLKRLSQAVSAKLMENNPNIADLSDENRPTKLAEKYSELYDNEWTDAYEEMEKELPNEQDVIKHIYQRLLDVFDFCQKSSKEYSRSLESCALGLPSLTVGNRTPKSAVIGVTQMRQLKEVKKSFSPFLVENVFEKYVENKNLKLEKKPQTAKFISKCVEIFWLMSSQDTPVILDTGNLKGPFDSDRYRTYTKTGKTVDFVVWPPLLLHKDGPLLAKGVAEGK